MDIRNQTLTQIAQHLDISPTDFKLAQERYREVKDWLIDGLYESGSSPLVYLQGSFRLGTVVKPYRGDRDGAFDIDQVCEITVPKSSRAPKILKHDVGDRLKENADYERMLDDEGKRCWTIEYASADSRPGFHLDILPSLPTSAGESHQIDITDKNRDTYTWSISNPKGYYLWFKSKNVLSQELISTQRQNIYQENQAIYSRLGDVPKQLLRSPLQRSIQIMKRHRDVYFSGKEHKPISIIITTITAQIHSKDSITGVLHEFTNYVAKRHEALVRDGYLIPDGILDFDGNQWLIPNPADYANGENIIENFADKWNEESSLSEAFFDWAKQLARDVYAFTESGVSDDLNLKIKRFGEGGSYASILERKVKKEIEEDNSNSTNFLRLIHLGIEGKVEWGVVNSVAQLEYDKANNLQNKNIAKVNFYQIARHQGQVLSDNAKNDIKKVLADNLSSPAFVMCCNLILGTATKEMISLCVADCGYDNVLAWPIMKLANTQSL